MDTVDSLHTHLLYVSYVLQTLCLLKYFSLFYPVASPILIVIGKMYIMPSKQAITLKL